MTHFERYEPVRLRDGEIGRVMFVDVVEGKSVRARVRCGWIFNGIRHYDWFAAASLVRA